MEHKPVIGYYQITIHQYLNARIISSAEKKYGGPEKIRGFS